MDPMGFKSPLLQSYLVMYLPIHSRRVIGYDGLSEVNIDLYLYIMQYMR